MVLDNTLRDRKTETGTGPFGLGRKEWQHHRFSDLRIDTFSAVCDGEPKTVSILRHVKTDPLVFQFGDRIEGVDEEIEQNLPHLHRSAATCQIRGNIADMQIDIVDPELLTAKDKSIAD
jgi:hypothetical protein